MDIDNMPAGRETDILIVQDFLNKCPKTLYLWADRKQRSRPIRGCVEPIFTNGRFASRRYLDTSTVVDEEGNKHSGYWIIPRFSEDIGAMWDLIEHMSGWIFELVRLDDNEWQANFADEDTGEYYATADTAPLAVVRAILTLVMP